MGFKKKIKRLNLLLRSFDGSKAKRQKTNDDDEALHFSAVYERDRELDKVFWDFGGHASRIAFIKGWSHLLIDDDKTRLRSKKVAELILHQLATSYEMLNPIHGFTPGSPSRAIGYRPSCMNESTSEDSDGNYKEFKSSDAGGSRQLLSWKKEAKCYTQDVLQCSRNPYKKFIKDPTLDRIRKDTRLEHFPQSVPKKSSSSKKSSKGNKAIPKKKKTDRKESTRCALCVGLLGSSKAKKTVYFCPTCGVYLCNRRRGKSKSTCFKKWHTCTHLGSLTKKNTAMTPAPRTSPRRKKATGSVVTEDGKRRSTRGKK